MKYRDRTEIYGAILRTCNEKPKRVTDILIDIRLIAGYYTQYIRHLTEKGLLEKAGKTYAITPKGREWLQHYEALKKLESEDECEEES